jgi:hypothetical protein
VGEQRGGDLRVGPGRAGGSRCASGRVEAREVLGSEDPPQLSDDADPPLAEGDPGSGGHCRAGLPQDEARALSQVEARLGGPQHTRGELHDPAADSLDRPLGVQGADQDRQPLLEVVSFPVFPRHLGVMALHLGIAPEPPAEPAVLEPEPPQQDRRPARVNQGEQEQKAKADLQRRKIAEIRESVGPHCPRAPSRAGRSAGTSRSR